MFLCCRIKWSTRDREIKIPFLNGFYSCQSLKDLDQLGSFKQSITNMIFALFSGLLQLVRLQKVDSGSCKNACHEDFFNCWQMFTFLLALLLFCHQLHSLLNFILTFIFNVFSLSLHNVAQAVSKHYRIRENLCCKQLVSRETRFVSIGREIFRSRFKKKH